MPFPCCVPPPSPSPSPRHHWPHSREIGLVPIFLFSDVRPHGGGTALLRGSHKKVAEILWERAGTTGLTGKAHSKKKSMLRRSPYNRRMQLKDFYARVAALPACWFGHG